MPILRIVCTLLVPLVLASGLPTSVVAQDARADPLEVIRAHQATLETGDLDAILARYTEDAVFQGGAGPCVANPCVGKAAIRVNYEIERAEHAHITLSDLRVEDGTVAGRFEARADTIQATGVERIVGPITFEVVGDRIAATRSRPDPSDPETAAFLAAIRARSAAASAPPVQLPGK